MPLPASIAPSIKIFVFDAYGTLFDVNAAVARHASRIGPDAARLSEIWRSKQLEYSWVLSLCGRYEPFWMLTERALDYAFARCPEVDREVRADLLSAYRSLEAYAEVRTVLGALQRKGLRTAILSNGDPEMLRDAVASARLGALFDAALSIEAAGVFKTSPRAYALVREAFPVEPQEVAFVSSNRWDIAGAAAFGFTPIWVNRLGLPDEYPGLEPAMTVRTLAELM